MLTGDFNCPSLKWDEGLPIPINVCANELTDTFIQFTENNFLHQHVEEPTRTTDTTSNIPDLFTTIPNSVSDVNIIPGISDHDAILFLQFADLGLWS